MPRGDYLGLHAQPSYLSQLFLLTVAKEHVIIVAEPNSHELSYDLDDLIEGDAAEEIADCSVYVLLCLVIVGVSFTDLNRPVGVRTRFYLHRPLIESAGIFLWDSDGKLHECVTAHPSDALRSLLRYVYLRQFDELYGKTVITLFKWCVKFSRTLHLLRDLLLELEDAEITAQQLWTCRQILSELEWSRYGPNPDQMKVQYENIIDTYIASALASRQ